MSAIHDDTGVVFDLGEYAWKNPVGAGRKVKVGFRAEHFRTGEASAAVAPHVRFDKPVAFFEKSGPDALAFFSLPRQVVAARVDVRVADAHQAGKDISLVLPLDKINVFDAQSGRRL